MTVQPWSSAHFVLTLRKLYLILSAVSLALGLVIPEDSPQLLTAAAVFFLIAAFCQVLFSLFEA